MASSGSQGFVRGRASFLAPRSHCDCGTPLNGEKYRLKDSDYEKIISYLEIPENFAALVGGGRRTRVGAKYESKAVVIRQMLVAIQHNGFPDFINATNFSKMHAIYGARPNVQPALEGDVGVNDAGSELAAESFHTAKNCATHVAPTCTPSTPRRAAATERMWNELEEMANQPLPRHAISCQCDICHAFAGVHTGESRPTPTTSESPSLPTQVPIPPPCPPPAAPIKGFKTARQAAKEAAENKKPSFASVFSEKINLKNDFCNALIHSKDKWKTEEARERKEARQEVVMQQNKERKHRLREQAIAAKHQLKRVRAKQEHALLMAKAARHTTLMTTLMASDKTLEEIKALMPFVHGNADEVE
ncbi:unnamed protein product [Calypogeia fissa]